MGGLVGAIRGANKAFPRITYLFKGGEGEESGMILIYIQSLSKLWSASATFSNFSKSRIL